MVEEFGMVLIVVGVRVNVCIEVMNLRFMWNGGYESILMEEWDNEEKRRDG